MANWFKRMFNSSKKQEIKQEPTIKESKPVKITSTYQYKEELEKGTTEFDFSEFDLEYEDIQNINLEGLNLNIDLRNIFVPYNGSVKIGRNILSSIFNTYRGDYYINIKDSKLAGNNVTGDLSYFEGNSHTRPVYFWYSEATFDDKYKSTYPEFFLSNEAPQELRDKYYNPQIIYQEVYDPLKPCEEGEYPTKEIKSYVRHKLTLEDYLKYYEYLKGKYLGNFDISREDLIQIELIEKYGLEARNKILNHINSLIERLNENALCEEYTINQVDDKGVCLTLKLNFNKKDEEK